MLVTLPVVNLVTPKWLKEFKTNVTEIKISAVSEK